MANVTCGFDTEGIARTAEAGFDCRVDTQNGLWGFCEVLNTAASDCGFAGYCIDDQDCVEGCGPLKDRSDIKSITCEYQQFYSSVVSDNEFGQSFLNIACGEKTAQATIYATPYSVSATTTASSSTTQTESSITISRTESLPSDTSSSGSSNTLTTDTPSSQSLAPATSDTSLSSPSHSSTSLGPIIGGVLGSISVICLTVLAIFFIRHRSRRASSGHSISRLRRSSSCNKYDLREEPSDPLELVNRPGQYFEASKLNRDAAELSGNELDRQMICLSK